MVSIILAVFVFDGHIICLRHVGDFHLTLTASAFHEIIHFMHLVYFLTLCMLGNFSCFCCQLLFFKINFFQKSSFRNTIRVSNGLDPDQDRNSAKVISRWQKLPLAMKELKNVINRGTYTCAHVLLTLFNKLRKRNEMWGLLSILSLFRNEFNKCNKIRAWMLDSIYHMT